MSKEKPVKEKEEKSKKNQLELFLEENEEDHYNFYVTEYFKVSTGSLELDLALDGGLTPGIHRFGGASEGGKTSESLEVVKNFLTTVPNSKALIVKAEGRLGKKLMDRSGVKFVTNAADWLPGTCYVLKSNVYDTVAQFMYDLIKDNPENFKYIFVVDSLDGLMLKADLQKSIAGEESVKVCGPNVLTKLLFKKLSLPMSELGHMMIVITQIIAKIENKYEKKDQLAVSGGGGNAAIHFSNFILTFLPRYKDDLIVSDKKAVNFNFGESNIVGHWVNILLEKTENEKSKLKVTYPVKYGTQEEEGRIWNELEIKKILVMLGLAAFKGAWGGFSQPALEKMAAAGITDVPEKFNGETKFNEFIATPNIMEFWKTTLKKYQDTKDVI